MGKSYRWFKITITPKLARMRGLVLQVNRMLVQGQRKELESVHEFLCGANKVYLESQGTAYGGTGFAPLRAGYAHWKRGILEDPDSNQLITDTFQRPVTEWASDFGVDRPIMVLSGQLAESLFNRRHKQHTGTIFRNQSSNATILTFGTKDPIGHYHAHRAPRRRNVLLPVFFGNKHNPELVEKIADTIEKSLVGRVKNMISKIGGIK